MPQIPVRCYSLCKLFSCPGAYIMHFCHRFLQGTSFLRLICHVPAAEMQLFATDSGRRLLLVQAFFMSWCLYPALLPQIPARDYSLCKFFHVPVSISCASATDFSKGLLFIGSLVMSQVQKCGYLPQISDRVLPSSAHLSCPRCRNVAICHKFRSVTTPCASFFHVPVPISCASATDFR